MTGFENILDSAAAAVMSAFRVSGSYFYEERTSGERIAVDCIENTIEFVETDKSGETFVKTGKGFYIKRETVDKISGWLAKAGRTNPLCGGDCIVKVKDNAEERYEINYREPFKVIGTNAALYRINTALKEKWKK